MSVFVRDLVHSRPLVCLNSTLKRKLSIWRMTTVCLFVYLPVPWHGVPWLHVPGILFSRGECLLMAWQPNCPIYPHGVWILLFEGCWYMKHWYEEQKHYKGFGAKGTTVQTWNNMFSCFSQGHIMTLKGIMNSLVASPWATLKKNLITWVFSQLQVVTLYNSPRCSMYALFTYIWVVLGVNVRKYTIHWAFG